LSQTFLVLRRNERDIINVHMASRKAPVIDVRCRLNLTYFDRFSESTHISYLMRMRRVGAKLFHADGQTDMIKVIVTFRHFANAPKNEYAIHCAVMVYVYFHGN
jgi:hypothetical protein